MEPTEWCRLSRNSILISPPSIVPWDLSNLVEVGVEPQQKPGQATKDMRTRSSLQNRRGTLEKSSGPWSNPWYLFQSLLGYSGTDTRAKQAAEGKKVHTGGGFSGKGFKFDEAEAMMASEKKKFQKAALGLQDSDDEDLEHDIDQQIENMLAPKRIVKEIKAPIGGINPAAQVLPNQMTPTATDKLELARRLASKINMAKNLGAEAKGATQQAAEAILKGGGSQPLITAKTVAEQLAAKLNNKLNYQPKEEDEKAEEETVETFRKYEEELEINDFPQTARWRVTSKEALAQISEYSEAGITVRGTYYPQNKSPPEGERKLYLAIESTNELAVSKAKIEITRLIKEELLKLQSSAHHIMNKARYKVV
ncbi:unnamed protein product [Timema podura]|uniref:ATP-dependent RNA helicase PRP5/DDX46/KHDC4 KH domain-containing protein n=1 Tax=Timema podura TaxID=61482 RepID=A0ABN7NHV1_TIMPD|nr:unnamed protein product [Timema podura]